MMRMRKERIGEDNESNGNEKKMFALVMLQLTSHGRKDTFLIAFLTYLQLFVVLSTAN